MLQDIRANSQGTIAKIIIGLIVISFSIFGIESLLFSGGNSGVAQVNGEDISPFALQQELSVQQRQLLALLGDDADPSLLDQGQMTQQALETLIQREIIKQAATDLGLGSADSSIGEIIGSMQQFQIDGQFSPDMFQSALAAAGFTPTTFRQRLAEDIQIGQLRAGLAGSDFATPRELEIAAKVRLEGRDVRYITLPQIDYFTAAEVTDAAIQAYYDANTESFRSEERVIVEYMELGIDAYRAPVDDARVREEFELVRGEFELETEARVSHILLEGNDSTRQTRLAEVQAALAAGMAFAEAAETFSDDIGSARLGGDLGYTAGDTFPEAMEEAIVALGVGEQSGPVETEAGTHLLLITDRREGSEASFEDVAAELESRIQQSEAAAALLTDVERLRDIAFNAADLAGPAAELDREVQRTEPFSRGQGDGIFARPLVEQAVFSEDVLEAGHNSEVIELSPERFVVLRVAQRQPPAVQSLAEVRAEIDVQLREDSARRAAAAQAESLLADLEAGARVEDVANAAGLQWQVELGARRDTLRLPVAVRERLFAMQPPAAQQPLREVVSGDAEATYVIEFSRLTEGSLASVPVEEAALLRQRIAGETAGLLQQQFERALRDRADIEVY